ncbi:hypothetical protein G6F42_019007 [Rhizopus arrhizus]|nr:hypothetical protein G6F42_019007 [Rhizopus arrhizus]
MHIGLAKSLFIKPNILLLDEPANHLDLPAIVRKKKLQGQAAKSSIALNRHPNSFVRDLPLHVRKMTELLDGEYYQNYTLKP